MGFNSMFSALASDGENSDRIFTRNGVKCKHMSGKQPITFTILPAMDPANPDKATSWLPSLLPTNPVTLSEWGGGAEVYRKFGKGDWKERYDIVSLSSVGEECPLDAVFNMAKKDPTWKYLTEDIGKFGDPNRVPATIAPKRKFMFCNVFLPNEPERVSHVGIFTFAVAKKIVGEGGIVFQPSPSATEESVQANYLSAFANGDITAPNGAPAFVIEKGHDKGEMSAYEVRFALDANRRVMRIPATPEIMATRCDLSDLRSYLNILSADQIVQILIRELSGRSPAGYHEYALLKLALGSRYQIPEPPAAPAATHTIQAGFAAPAAPEPAPAPAAQAPSPAPQPTAPSAEANAALSAAVAAGAAAPAPAQGTAQVTGDPIPKFDKEAFLARLAKGGQQ